MWRNADVLDFVGWLRAHNDGLAGDGAPVGFHGLDLYSLGASIEAVIGYLDAHDPDAAERARRRYECLQPYSGESSEYGRAVLLGVGESCRRHVLRELVDLRRRAGDYLRRDGAVAEDEYFFAEQNAVVVADAEEYYRTMFGDAAASWNLRDRHMADTLDQLHGAPGPSRRQRPRGRLGAQLAHRRRARHPDGAAGRAQHRPADARAPPARRRPRGLHHARRHRHGRLRLGRAGRADARAARPPRKLRGPLPRGRHPRLPALPARGRSLRAARCASPASSARSA